MILDKVDNPSDVKKLTLKEKKELAGEIREFLVDKVSKTGGHLASNLGIVELTIALFSSFDFDKDKVIFDVGHQSYVYKLLTGRKNKFDSLRKYKGLRGFPYPKESKYDFFETGHSGTSISACLGMARARDLKKDDFNVISVVGDGSISNGINLEAMNDLGYNKTKMIIILNDNGMSISANVGGISSYLSRVSLNKGYLKVKNKVSHSLDDTKVGVFTSKVLSRLKDGMRSFLVPSKYFEDIGLTYIGPLDGHDIGLMTKVFNKAKNTNEPVVIHVVTKKGKGYAFAEDNPDIYHAVGTFDKEKGVILSNKDTYSSSFGKAMENIAKDDERIVAITAAMRDGVGLSNFFLKYPERSFDVGIAEEHAVTFSAGLALQKIIPVCAIYSTFMQRSFDSIIHDICMQNLHVILCLDRAGIVGNDGETHQGTFDLAYLSLIPNMVVMAPKCTQEMEVLLRFAVKYNGPIAIRYSRGGDEINLNPLKKVTLGKWETIDEGKDVAIIATGKMVQRVIKASEKYNLRVTIINATFIKPLDEDMLEKLIEEEYNIITIEDGILDGGMGSLIQVKLNELGFNKKIISMGFDDKFIQQGSPNELYDSEGLSYENIRDNVEKLKK